MIEKKTSSISVPPGNNHIIRRSNESSVTIPSDNIFEPEVIRQKISSKSNTENSSYCLSGWPAHLLIPKGTKQGANFLLFVMISKDNPVRSNKHSGKIYVYEYICFALGRRQYHNG